MTLLLLLIATPAKAEIYILIDQFTPEQRFPIAVADLSGSSDTAHELTEMLKKNLNLAGYFEVIDRSRFTDHSGHYLPEDINFSKWTGIGARGLITGVVKGGSTVELRLFDPQLGKMLVGKRYKVKKKALYVAIHRFMDEILLALTGERGFYNTKIVAACGPLNKRQIMIMNVDGTGITPITKNKVNNISPSWSPFADRIAYTSYASYFPEIYISGIKGGKGKRITFNKALNITPAFTPDGNYLAVSSSMGGDPDLYLFDTEGNQVRQITQTTGVDIAPTFSPDGERLIFASERAGNLHLFAVNKQGGETTRLTYFGYQNDSPDWSPRSDKVVFSTRVGGQFNVALMNADGSGFQQLTQGGGSNESPTFSPDGRFIVYSTVHRDAKSELKLMMWDGYNQTVIENKNNCINSDWSNWLDAAEKQK
ncbi:MAG: PD40 domain-containing protein [Deltaproteobacteria bacterium]|nr:PD40 domain-containing protein [Deltaproteobacteria bacterium]